MGVDNLLDSFSCIESSCDENVSQIYSDIDLLRLHKARGGDTSLKNRINTIAPDVTTKHPKITNSSQRCQPSNNNFISSHSSSFLERDPDDGYLVLVVDDSIVSRKITQSKLSGTFLGHCWKVFSAENGEVALDEVLYTAGMSSQQTSAGAYGKRIPDVIIIDQQMHSTGGRMLGHEVVTCIRSHSAFKNVIIIGCTSFADHASGLMFASGCDAVWNKPMPSQSEAVTQILELMSFRGVYTHEVTMDAATGTGVGTNNKDSIREGYGGFSFQIPSEKVIATIGYSQLNNNAVKSSRLRNQKKVRSPLEMTP